MSRVTQDVIAICYQDGQYCCDFFFLNLTKPYCILNPIYSVINCTLIKLNVFSNSADLNLAELSSVFLLLTQYKE